MCNYEKVLLNNVKGKMCLIRYLAVGLVIFERFGYSICVLAVNMLSDMNLPRGLNTHFHIFRTRACDLYIHHKIL